METSGKRVKKMDSLVKVQHQIKQNSDELQDFLRDLNQWKEEMTKKEKEIGDVVTSNTPLPPIRGSRGGSTKINVSQSSGEKKRNSREKIKNEEKFVPKTKEKRISSYDYNAWDKYDADKACEDIEADVEKKEDSVDECSEEEEEEDYQLIRNREAAEESKEKGNDFFRMGKIDQAIECYTQGMLTDPRNPLLPANRALALLKKELYGPAEQDCNLALEIDPNYIKAYQRRGTARMALMKNEEAMEDFRKVMELEPGNRQAYEQLQKLRKIEEMSMSKSAPLPDAKRIEITEISSECDEKVVDKKVGIVKAIQKPPHLRSKKPLKRMRIQEVSTKFKQTTCQKSPELPDEVKNLKAKAKPMPETDNSKTAESTLVVPDPPQSLHQFQRAWKMLKGSKEKQYEYLKKIPCSNYVTIFDDFLEADNISEFVYIFNKFYLRDNLDVFLPLKELAAVKRFQIQTLFLSSNDTKVIKELFLHLLQCPDNNKEEIKELAKLYQISV